METKIIARVNNVDIVSTNDEQLVAIKPICEALGISDRAQRTKIQEHPILSSVGMLSILTGRDGKQYEMYSLPAKYILAWLLNINPNNVNDDAKGVLIRYQSECYDVIYDYFNNGKQRIIEQNQVEIALLEQLADYNQQKESITKSITETKRKLEKLREERLKNEPMLF